VGVSEPYSLIRFAKKRLSSLFFIDVDAAYIFMNAATLLCCPAAVNCLPQAYAHTSMWHAASTSM
jgi:hypothetical protein